MIFQFKLLETILALVTAADMRGADKVIPDHVRTIVGKLDPAITEEDIVDLPSELHLLALLSVVISLRGKSKPYSSVKVIRGAAEVLEHNRGAKGLVSDLEDLLQDLRQTDFGGTIISRDRN